MNFSIAITPGEPASIGPDVVLQLAEQNALSDAVIIADKNLLQERAAQLHLNINWDALSIIHIPLRTHCTPGKLNKQNASYVLNCLERAATGCLKGEFKALVTGPVHKGVINEAGIPFSGHTEFLAQLSKTPRSVMLLANQQLKIALLTTHLPLAKVPEAITPDNLRECLSILQHDLITTFKIAKPRIAVCGLNPHAGEGGHLGTEERDIITPTLNELRLKGMNLLGPLSADTAFTPKQMETYDAILTMYHDQGLPVIKSQSFGETVNITLGLPFVRTSVDHGTALPLAGTGGADSNSLSSALAMAKQLVNR